MEAPHEEHMVVVKRVLRYVAGTHTHGLYYSAVKKDGHD
jgi:hypothetical protein